MKKDEIKVLDVLEQHAKENIGEIAKKCDFSPQKVVRIIKNLEQRKIIWGYTVTADGTLQDYKHYVLLTERNTVPVDISFKKEVTLEKIENYVPGSVRIEDIFFTHGRFNAVITFYAPDLIKAKNFCPSIL